MLSLDNPELAAMLKHPPAPAPILVDWLQEHDADEADMAVLTAGTPPHHQDGLPLVDAWGTRALAIWLERQGQTQQARLVNLHQLRIIKLSNDNTFDSVVIIFPPDPGDLLRVETEFFWGEEQEAMPRARRAIKRKILGLPWAKEVRVERRAEVPNNLWSDLNDVCARSLAFRRCMEKVCFVIGLPYRSTLVPEEQVFRLSQTPTAPQLIWPEPLRGHVPGAALDPDAFRESEAVSAHVDHGAPVYLLHVEEQRFLRATLPPPHPHRR